MNIGDIFRSAYRKADDLWIAGMGKPVLYYERPEGANNLWAEKLGPHYKAFLRGMYELPGLSEVSVFGIDTPDEILIELSLQNTLDILYKPPTIGSIVITYDGSQWMIIQRSIEDDALKGQGRLVLTCTKFQLSCTTGKEGK